MHLQHLKTDLTPKGQPHPLRMNLSTPYRAALQRGCLRRPKRDYAGRAPSVGSFVGHPAMIPSSRALRTASLRREAPSLRRMLRT